MERSAQQSPVQKTLENLDEILIRLKNEHTLPSLAVGVVQDGELVFAKGYGLANIEKEIPATPDTIFRIGSISKTFTAIGIMQLWEQGRFQLDDPVNDYLQAYKIDPAGSGCSARDLPPPAYAYIRHRRGPRFQGCPAAHGGAGRKSRPAQASPSRVLPGRLAS